MPYDYSETAAVLNKIFIDGYFGEYGPLRYKNKKKLLEYIDVSYKRWFYSALAEGTIITPCLLFLKLDSETKKNAYTVPAMRSNDTPNAGNVEFEYITYTLDDHPIVKDIKTFLDACVPFLELTEDELLSEDFRKAVTKRLTLRDKYYADYLLEICLLLKLIKPMPAIYSNKAQLTSKAVKFLKQGKREIFDNIFIATLDLAIINMRQILPPGIIALNRDYFLKLIKNPIPIDIIFKKIYEGLGLDIASFIERINESDTDEPDILGGFGDLNDMMLSSTYFLGIILDRCFITPMGHYLKLIMPFYYMGYEYKQEFKYLKEELKEIDDMSAAIWAPPSSYSLSPLGLSYMGVAPSGENHVVIPEELSLNVIIDTLKNGVPFITESSINHSESERHSSSIYEVKIKVSDNRKYWAVLAISGGRSLHDLHYELCDVFYLDFGNEYSINLDESKSPFMHYVSPGNKKKNKKTDSVTLEQLALAEGQIFAYSMPNVTNPFVRSGRLCTFKVVIEIIKVKAPSPLETYPFVAKKSKALLDFDEEMNADLPF